MDKVLLLPLLLLLHLLLLLLPLAPGEGGEDKSVPPLAAVAGWVHGGVLHLPLQQTLQCHRVTV